MRAICSMKPKSGSRRSREPDAVDVRFVDPEVDDIKGDDRGPAGSGGQVDEFEAVSVLHRRIASFIAGVSAGADSFVPSAVRGLFSFS